jgi:two-component sensor histidine kinase/streptogramin lyase
LTSSTNIPCIEKLKNVSANIHFSQGGGVATFITYSPASLLLTNFAELYQILDAKELGQFPNLEIDQVICDNEHNYWILTSHGVIYVKLKKNRFTHYFIHTDETSDRENNQVRGIYFDGQGTLYANLWDRLFIKTPDSQIHSCKGKSILYPIVANKGSIYSLGVLASVYDKKSNSLIPLSTSGAGKEIWSTFILENDMMLLGMSTGISLLNLKTKELKNIPLSTDQIPEPKNSYRIFKNSGNIWIAAENGLYKLTSTGSSVIDYFGTNTKKKNSLPFASLHDVHLDSSGIFWLATNGDGLYRWDRITNKFSHFNITSGFLSDVLYRIEEDNFQHLWISTDNGLIHFNKSNFSSHVYRKPDGLSHNEFNRISSFKDTNGTMYFGGMSGINSFNPIDFRNEMFVINTPLRITYFSKFSSAENKLTNYTTTLIKENKITLKPGDRFLHLTFRLLDFGEDAHLYAYMIEGLDKQWSFIKDGSLRISGLPYGNYTLLVKGQNASGRWSRNELKIPIEVLKPFYLTAWFFIIGAVFLMLLIALFMKLRVYNLEKINLLLEKKVEKRTEELKHSLEQKDILFQEVHHRVKNNLQVIASLLQLQNSRTDNEETRMAILESQNRVFSISFIHQNLYQSGLMEGVEMSTFVNELTGHIRNIFYTPDLLIEAKNSISNVILDIDTAVPFGLLINELMTNSYKYAFKGKNSGTIKLSLIDRGNGNYFFTYEDDGIGMPPGYKIEKAETLGMRLVHQLSRQIAGRFTFSSEGGIKFELEFKDSEARNKIL